MTTAVSGLVVGRRYLVRLEDCCIGGEFTAVLTELTIDEGIVERAAFDNGVVLERSMGVSWEEA